MDEVEMGDFDLEAGDKLADALIQSFSRREVTTPDRVTAGVLLAVKTLYEEGFSNADIYSVIVEIVGAALSQAEDEGDEDE
jgi:hypothetical protein